MFWLPSWSLSLLGGGRLGPLFGLLLGQDGLGPSNVATRDAQRAGVGELLRGLLHAQAEVGLLQVLDFGFEAGNVFFAQFSSFHISSLLNQAPIMRLTNVVRSGSLAAARRNASRASSSVTPPISNTTLPGWISAT